MFPANVIQQAERDAEAARRANPDRNVFQRAQDFLREKLAKMTAKPDSKPLTSQQQTQADADAARRATKKLQKAKNVKSLQGIRKAGSKIPLAKFGLTITGAGLIANWMKDNLDVNTSGSGRGEGSAAFKASPEPKPTYGTVTEDIKPSDYPEGISPYTNLSPRGPGNPGGAQSNNPDESAYIPPSGPITSITPVPDPVPVETTPDAPVNTGTEIETLVKQTETKEPYSVFDDPRFMNARERAQKRIKDIGERRRDMRDYAEDHGITPKEARLIHSGGNEITIG